MVANLYDGCFCVVVELGIVILVVKLNFYFVWVVIVRILVFGCWFLEFVVEVSFWVGLLGSYGYVLNVC